MKSIPQRDPIESALSISTTRELSLVRQTEGINRPTDTKGDVDPLTGIATRRRLIEFLDAFLIETKGSPTRPALILLDLDRFKKANDSFGPLICDTVLCRLAQRLRTVAKDAALIARISGDGFAVVVKDAGTATALAARLSSFLSRSFSVSGHVVNIGTSIGICNAGESDDALGLLQGANTALHEAQRTGGGQFCYFDISMRERAHNVRLMESDLRAAVANLRVGKDCSYVDQPFEVHYQPQIALADGRLTGFEALLRWRHAERGFVPPDQFIPLAEELGLISILGDWVLRIACRDAMLWPQANGCPALRVAVNISPLQLKDGRALIGALHKALVESGLPASRLETELTETALEHDIGDTLATIRGLGIGLALDDFGTGYSSLGRLLHLPFDRIKIDRSFIADLNRNELGQKSSEKVISAIASLGAALGLTTIVEGIETPEQMNIAQTQVARRCKAFSSADLYPPPMLTI
jgi:diguanylate cyclase (GGDEF)-like protein